MAPNKAERKKEEKEEEMNELLKEEEERRRVIKIGLVWLFNGISTFVGYLMPNLFSLKNSSGTM